jgi:hypothetical protein
MRAMPAESSGTGQEVRVGKWVTTSSLNDRTKWHGPGHSEYNAVAAKLGSAELERRLMSPAYACRTAELCGLWRANCRWPYTCCSTERPAWAYDEHGSPRAPPGSP